MREGAIRVPNTLRPAAVNTSFSENSVSIQACRRGHGMDVWIEVIPIGVPGFVISVRLQQELRA